ncbi:hypothetical protein [Promicromonospora sp. NPDC023987]|uniref:hypothetical protein n=1 Tax=Promicromonospora sp. NPDC023987 TaxID=3155360 RepID=UPI003411EBBF
MSEPDALMAQRARDCAVIQDLAGLERLTRKPASIFLDAAASFQDDRTWWLS